MKPAAAGLLSAVVVALAAWPVGARQDVTPQRPAFRTDIDAVRIDVLALDHGKPIPGLTADDFEVKDNGVVQHVDLATVADHVSLAIAWDVQGSRWPQENRELQAAARTLAAALTPKDTAWLVTFAQSFALDVSATHDPREIDRAISAAKLGRGKTMWDAVFASVSLVAGRDGRALVIVISDGQEPFFETGWLREDRTIDLLKRGEVTVAAVQPRSAVVSPTGLERAAKATGGIVIEAEHNTHLAEQFTELLNEFRLGYIVTFTPQGVGHSDGWHSLSVKLTHHSGSVKAREGYDTGTR